MVTVDLPLACLMVDALRIAIAEDSAILRDGLVQLLVDRGFAITGAVGDAGRAAQLGRRRTRPTWR